jgi:hypothetical protein
LERTWKIGEGEILTTLFPVHLNYEFHPTREVVKLKTKIAKS